jgi:hypothetical protein
VELLSAVVAAACLETTPAVNIQHVDSGIYYFVGRLSYTLLNIFAIRMAGVFIFSTCTSHCARQSSRAAGQHTDACGGQNAVSLERFGHARLCLSTKRWFIEPEVQHLL